MIHPNIIYQNVKKSLNIGKKTFETKPKTKIQWLEAAWKVVAHYLGKVYHKDKTAYV
jgi:hypothetical protein